MLGSVKENFKEISEWRWRDIELRSFATVLELGGSNHLTLRSWRSGLVGAYVLGGAKVLDWQG